MAGALARHKGMLNLDSLTSLSGGAAEALSDHKGGLSLNRLKTLAPAFASRLPNLTESYFSTESQSYRLRPSRTFRSSMAVCHSTAGRPSAGGLLAICVRMREICSSMG